MKQHVSLPYVSHYFPGSEMKLNWLAAITANDRLSARHLNWHAHDELELIFPLRGHYRYEFKRRKCVSIDSESFIVIPGGTSHRLAEAIDPPGGRLHLYLMHPSKVPAGKGTLTRQEYSQIYEALLLKPLCRVPVSASFKAILAPLGRIVTKSPAPLSQHDRLQIRFLSCLTLCNSVTQEAPAKLRSPSRMFAEAVSWLERNYSQDVHMDQLVDHIGFSRARFFALFRRQTGMTPAEYLRNHRLRMAKEMLLNTDLTASRIGKACGLGDPAHFSRLFAKMTGYTPRVYRQKRRATESPGLNSTSAQP